jgi:hypothetical protein
MSGRYGWGRARGGGLQVVIYPEQVTVMRLLSDAAMDSFGSMTPLKFDLLGFR